MRPSTLALIALLAIVQAQLWFGRGGVPRTLELSAQVAAQKASNEAAREHNTRLSAEVSDLKTGLDIIEEKARSELGMVRPDEILVQIAPPR